MIVSLFEATYTARATMVAQVKELLFSYNMLDKVITYVKVEGGNLNSTTIALFHVNLQHFKLLGKGLALGMLLTMLVNIHGMTQRFVLGFKRSISSRHK